MLGGDDAFECGPYARHRAVHGSPAQLQARDSGRRPTTGQNGPPAGGAPHSGRRRWPHHPPLGQVL
eukprot:5846635-Prorocentrum_lima.AAC.1